MALRALCGAAAVAMVGAQTSNWLTDHDYSLEDLNPVSATYGEEVGPTYFPGKITMHYFGHQSWPMCQARMRAITQYFNKLVAAGNGDKIIAFGVGKPDITNHNAIDLFIGEADYPVVEDLDTQCAIATDDVDLHPCLSTWADWGAVQRDFFVIGVDGALLHKINLTPGFIEGPIDAIVQAALADVPGSTVNGVRAPMCADSPPQLCRMVCPDTVCPTGQCAMRAGSCCDLSCQGGGGSDCVGDVNNDRSINVTDLLQLLGQFGSSGAGGEDITGDGTVSVTDLLQLLAAFGNDC